MCLCVCVWKRISPTTANQSWQLRCPLKALTPGNVIGYVYIQLSWEKLYKTIFTILVMPNKGFHKPQCLHVAWLGEPRQRVVRAEAACGGRTRPGRERWTRRDSLPAQSWVDKRGRKKCSSKRLEGVSTLVHIMLSIGFSPDSVMAKCRAL